MPARPLVPIAPPVDLSPVRIKVSYRWLTGTLLNGVVGIALMGGALYAAIDGQSNFAVEPVLALASQASASPEERKSDKFANATGQSVRLTILDSNTRLLGDKEFIEIKRYARVAAQLAMTDTELTANMPPFDPLQLFSEAAAAEENSQSPENTLPSHGVIDVSLVDMAVDAPSVDTTLLINNIQARNMVREALELSGSIGRYTTPGEFDDGYYSSGDETEANSNIWEIGATPVREQFSNYTRIQRSAFEQETANLADRVIVVQSGNSISSILTGNGATGQEVREIVNAIASVFPVNALLEGQEIRLQYSRDLDARDQAPARVSFFGKDGHIATVGRAETGGFTLLDTSEALVAATDGQEPAAPQGRVSLYQSLYETGFQQSIPEAIIDQIIRNHSYDVDFKRNVQAGDTLEVFYQMADEFDGNSEPEILYSALTVRGETRRFYRFRTPDDGRVDFYDEDGNSAKKFLIRVPVNGAVLRSRFGMRRHPILGTMKLHTGVDLTAPRYTPIVAAGNGVVERAGWSQGYGRRTVIRHANGYKTTYSHQQGFVDGLEPGVRVRQGQVIGYVGSSGLSTGPHLHYEVSVNGNYVDPMTIRVPRGRSLQGRNLAAYQRERERIRRLMQQPPASTRIATAETGITN